MTRTKVFVGNLSFKTKREDLAAEFQAAGRVVEANIITRGTRSLGYGFVEMESEEDAKKAIEIMNKKSVDSREINVELAKPRDETKIGERRPPPQRRPRRSPNPRGPGGNGNGNGSGSPQQSPQQGGNKDNATGSPAPRKQRGERKSNNNNNNNAGGNAANSAESPKEGSKEGGNGGDRTPGARRFRTGGRRYRSGGRGRFAGGAAGGAPGAGGARKDLPPRKESETSLFIANLPFSIDNAGLVDLYKAFNVKTAHVVANRNGKSKGFGFVELATQADQKAALDATNKTSVQGRELIVKIALTPVEQPKESQGDNTQAAPKEEPKN